ncbi:MAG: hypothetical protein LBC74_08415 [Planctomycetaceae bacterium]|nr:hypothetical protein [Planctomycetaceae bacterium]
MVSYRLAKRSNNQLRNDPAYPPCASRQAINAIAFPDIQKKIRLVGTKLPCQPYF